MVYCVAFICTTRSGQGFGLFEFTKDEMKRKMWTIQSKRKDFVPSKTFRLCLKHFRNDQFVLNPALALKIGHKLKKLQLKPGAESTLFDFSTGKTTENSTADDGKKEAKAVKSRCRMKRN